MSVYEEFDPLLCTWFGTRVLILAFLFSSKMGWREDCKLFKTCLISMFMITEISEAVA